MNKTTPSVIIHKGERVAPDHCPKCKSLLDSVTQADYTGDGNGLPSPGAFTICAYCGEVLQFNDKLRLVFPNKRELASALKNSTFAAIVEAGRQAALKAQHPHSRRNG